MPKDITSLCSERHYMGSSSSGRYATDRSVRPCYERLPDPAALAQGRAARAAHHARYLREQDVVGWVLACERAKSELERATGLLDDLRRRIVARAGDDIPAGARAGAEAPGGASGDPSKAELEQAAELLQGHIDRTLARRREASRQLRLIGVSPQAQARVYAEVRRRSDRNR